MDINAQKAIQRTRIVLISSAIVLSMNCFAENEKITSLIQLNDSELSEVKGQALMSLSYLAPTDATNPMRNITSNNIGFYKLGLEAELELNANIRNLQLGCGGVNGAGACDIDIKNLSLSGLPNTYDSNGNPVYLTGRPSTSGKITNPFLEFAISNPNSSSIREVKGIRFSAEKINALLTAGLDNLSTASQTDGIQRLSGFMQIAKTSGTASTKPIIFGKNASDQTLTGVANISGLVNVNFTSNPFNNGTTGITIPSVSTSFDINPFTINGVRNTIANVKDIRTTIATIPIASDGTSRYPESMFINDALKVNLSCESAGILSLCPIVKALVPVATFKMANGSNIQNINMSIDFMQSLSMIHNIPLTGTGGYLSVQSEALLWPGATIADIDKAKNNLQQMGRNTDVAQKGWWMSFADPVQLGKLNVSNQVDIGAVLPQVATLVSQYLNKRENYPYLNIGQAWQALTNQPITQKLNVDLRSYTENNPAKLVLTNQKLTNQNVVANCYGSLKFC
ncbi:hypothetical protein [Acinetobacter bereziniae]|uniref:hypothetical protein n=1 Tax=Acinetobacter bereziniae TaxID=106648 RepID=UPI0006661F74|nr:hypothetical protein [Acinetobacter bereziniae]MBJ8427540.1 hypothetical protein [Acinetobacter bereziniae]MBJ8477514.1 hypothetical protein [Acinetobacter bereziniae]